MYMIGITLTLKLLSNSGDYTSTSTTSSNADRYFGPIAYQNLGSLSKTYESDAGSSSSKWKGKIWSLSWYRTCILWYPKYAECALNFCTVSSVYSPLNFFGLKIVTSRYVPNFRSPYSSVLLLCTADKRRNFYNCCTFRWVHSREHRMNTNASSIYYIALLMTQPEIYV